MNEDAEERVVGHAYKAMEFKANELLALKGFRSKSHVCSQAALSKLLDRPDLARRLSQAYEDRQAYDYTSNPASMRAADSLEGFLENAEAYIRGRRRGDRWRVPLSSPALSSLLSRLVHHVRAQGEVRDHGCTVEHHDQAHERPG